MSTTPNSRKPTPMTSGGPRPNQESPDSEFSGLARSMQDLDEHPGQDQAAQQRGQPDQDRALGALEQLAPVVDGAGEAGDPVVEGDHQPQGGDGVEQDVLADDGQAQYQAIDSTPIQMVEVDGVR
jgi:hypothetical protein